MTDQGPQNWPPQPPPAEAGPPGYSQPPAYGQQYPQPGQQPYGQPPAYGQPGQQQYPQPGYGPGGYPAAPGGYGYPVPGSGASRVSVVWTGFVLAVAGLAAAIGSFMTWAKAVADFDGSSASIAGTDGQRDGKITVVLGAMLLIIGILIAVKQGRLWAGIVGIVLSVICAFVALADIGDISDKSKKLKGLGHIDVGAGLVIVLIAALVALGISIVAVCVRRVPS